MCEVWRFVRLLSALVLECDACVEVDEDGSNHLSRIRKNRDKTEQREDSQRSDRLQMHQWAGHDA